MSTIPLPKYWNSRSTGVSQSSIFSLMHPERHMQAMRSADMYLRAFIMVYLLFESRVNVLSGVRNNGYNYSDIVGVNLL